jgi:hypothetical protein
MKLLELNFNSKYRKIIVNNKLLTCGYGRLYDFDYNGKKATDSRPSVLSLGRWISPKGNNLLAGVNLNYLSDEQINRLQRNLQSILRDRNLRRRVKTLRALMPDIFNTSYRTYDRNYIQNINPGTLKFISIPKDPEKIDTSASTDVPRPEIAPNSSIDADDVEAPQIDSDLAAQTTPEDEKMRKVDIKKPEQPRKDIEDLEEPEKDLEELEQEENEEEEEI